MIQYNNLLICLFFMFFILQNTKKLNIIGFGFRKTITLKLVPGGSYKSCKWYLGFL